MVFLARKYQTDGLDQVARQWMAGKKRVLLVAPTGSGKGSMACMVIERALANGKTVMLMAHRRNLVQQLAERLMSFGVPYRVEMANLPDETWVRQDANPRVWVCSKDTLISRCKRPGADAVPNTDLLLIDESHRADEDQYSLLLDKCGASFWLGMTATPIRPDGAGLGKKNWDVIVQAATVKGLTEEGHLMPLHVFQPPGVSRRRKAGEMGTGVAGDPVGHWQRYAAHVAGGRTIAFLRGVEEARGVAKEFEDAGIPSAVLHAGSPNEERSDILGKVRDGKILWLGNVNLFVEGADLPALVCCQLLRKFSSLQGFIQAVGRVLRPCPEIGKTHGILLDHSAAFSEHLYPELEIEWALDETGEEFKKRVKKEKEEKLAETVRCHECGGIFAGLPKCPFCGAAIPQSQKKRKPVIERELLVPVGCQTGAQKKSAAQRIWDTVLAKCRAKGMKVSQASVLFCREFGKYPEQAGVWPVFDWSERQETVSDAERAKKK